MKIRTGFVSNSSSSSFLMAGFPIEGEQEVIELLEKTFPGIKENVEKKIQEVETKYKFKVGERDIFDYYSEQLWKMKIGIEIDRGSYEDGEFVIGISFMSVIDGSSITLETFLENASEATNKVRAIFPDHEILIHPIYHAD